MDNLDQANARIEELTEALEAVLSLLAAAKIMAFEGDTALFRILEAGDIAGVALYGSQFWNNGGPLPENVLERVRKAQEANNER